MTIPSHLLNYKVIGQCPTHLAEQLTGILHDMGYYCQPGSRSSVGGVDHVRIRYYYEACPTCDEDLLNRLRGMVELFRHLIGEGLLRIKDAVEPVLDNPTSQAGSESSSGPLLPLDEG